MKTSELKVNQILNSNFNKSVIQIIQINDDLSKRNYTRYTKSFLVLLGIEQEWFSEQQLENFILDYSYKLQNI